MTKNTAKLEKKPKAYKVSKNEEVSHEKILTAEGHRRAMLKKLKMKKD